MAKKKQDLSKEELLEQSLVTESEQPYKVPENWVWVRLVSVSEIVTGWTPSKNNDKYYGGNFPFVKPADLDQGRHVIFSTEYLSDEGKKVSRVIPAKSTSVCCIGTVGKSGYLEMEATTNQQINSIIPKIDSLFVYYYCNSEYFVNQLLDLASATTISIVNKSKMSKTILPLPPLAEQQRIVDRIESLFYKLNQAKELIQDALDSFENRKASILRKGFTGELTKKWRAENGVGQNSFVKITLGDCVIFSKEKCNPLTEKIAVPYIGLEHIEKNRGIVGKGYSEDIKSLKTVFHLGDILYGKLRPYLNKHDIVDFDGICSTDILVMRADNSATSKYLNYMFNTSSFIAYAITNSQGINLPRISETVISKFEFSLPSILEQEEIVLILDNILGKEINASELYNIIDNINLMKKAILARAFRGELGTNDPIEESSIGLLKKIL